MEREGLGLRSIFRSQGIKRVLDASCGAGAQAVPLAQMNFEVVAADPSTGMLKKAVQDCHALNVRDKMHFIRSDFIDLPKARAGTIRCRNQQRQCPAPSHRRSRDRDNTAQFLQSAASGRHARDRNARLCAFHGDRPRFLPGLVHRLEDGSEFITFDIWEWREGPPVLARQNLFIVKGRGRHYETIKRRVVFRPLSTDEVKVVLLEQDSSMSRISPTAPNVCSSRASRSVNRKG